MNDKEYSVVLHLYNNAQDSFWSLSHDTRSEFFDIVYGVTTPTPKERIMGKELAKALIKAVELREASFDAAAADKAQAEYHRAVAVGEPAVPPDYSSFYSKGLCDSCYEASSELAVPVYQLLSHHSGQVALRWARDILNEKL